MSVIRNLKPASLARLAGRWLRDLRLALFRLLVAGVEHLAQFNRRRVRGSVSVGTPEVHHIPRRPTAEALVDIFRRVNTERRVLDAIAS